MRHCELMLLGVLVTGGMAMTPQPGTIMREDPAPAKGGEEDTSSSITLVLPGEPGEPLVVSGTVYRHDGTTPAPGVRMQVYHTDARGYYNEGNRGTREPRILGWLTTDAKGRYMFRTIRPGPYPGSRGPAHIHSKVVVNGGEKWIDEFLFDDDPNVPEKDRMKWSGKGLVSPILKVTRGADGVLYATRNIILEE